MARRTLLSRLILPAVLAVVAIAVLSFIARGGALLRVMGTFRLAYLVPTLVLTTLNYVLRFARWQLYLGWCGEKPDTKRSAAVFASGLTMAITPGKFGELFKSALLKDSDGVPMSLSAPIVVVERLSDLVAVLALAALGTAWYSVGRTAVAVAAVLMAAVIVPLAVSPGLAARVGPWLARRGPLSRLGGRGARGGSASGDAPGAEPAEGAGSMERAAEVFGRLLRGRALVVGFVLGVLAWLAEGVGLLVVLHGFGVSDLAGPAAVFIYSLATLAGALSFLPGGLGATEASMAGLLIAFGVAAEPAAAATLVIRACTLWYAVVFGLVGYAIYRSLVGRAGPVLEATIADP